MLKKSIFISLIFILIWSACNQTTDHVQTQGNLQGTVSCMSTDGASPVYRAFIFWGDNLLATTDEQGSYRINNLNAGIYELLGSALFCGDTTLSVQIQGGRTVTLDFTLQPDSATGIVLGEFQDGTLWEQRLQEDSTLAEWSEQQVCDAATGATLQSKTLGYLVPDRFVSLSDSSITFSDAWGQYGIFLPSGTYPLTGTCDTYQSVTRIVKVMPDSTIYKNFILPREAIAKSIAQLNRY